MQGGVGGHRMIGIRRMGAPFKVDGKRHDEVAAPRYRDVGVGMFSGPSRSGRSGREKLFQLQVTLKESMGVGRASSRLAGHRVISVFGAYAGGLGAA